MKIFLDTANLEEIKKGASWGIVDGVTTNPSLIAKEGKPIEEQVRAICDIVDGDISAEVVATVYHSLGIELDTILPGPGNRPIPVVDSGTKPILELF